MDRAGPAHTVAHDWKHYAIAGFDFQVDGGDAYFVCRTRSTLTKVAWALNKLDMSFAIDRTVPGIALIMAWESYPIRGLDLEHLGYVVEGLAVKSSMHSSLAS